jgi:cation:H+ antiporter
MMTILLFLLSDLVLLVKGADLLVLGATRLAARFGVSPLVIGLTVVAYGTSAPELAVSLQASFVGNAGIAFANVVGSNIFNVLMVLGSCALIAPLTVAQQLVRLDIPIMIGISLLTQILVRDGVLGRSGGLLLVGGLVGYTLWILKIVVRRRATPQRMSQ